jgi:hypothetical protein
MCKHHDHRGASVLRSVLADLFVTCLFRHTQTRLWTYGWRNQLIGRIWRHPQLKSVHVYDLIAANTQDVFLDNNSFEKASIMEAFTNATPSIREL